MGKRFKNDEAGYAAFDKARSDKITEINLRCQELGIGMAPEVMQVARFNGLVDYMCGVLEGKQEDDGEIHTVRATGDRMEYEMAALDTLMNMVNSAGVAAAFDPATPRSTHSPSGLVLPGGMG